MSSASADLKALLEVGVVIGEVKAKIARLEAELVEARAVIKSADALVNGYSDNDYRIAVTVLRPYLAKYPEGAA